MSPLLTTRGAVWLPGVAVLGASVGLGTLLAVSLGVHNPAWYVGFSLMALLAMGAVERLWGWARHKAPAPSKTKSRLRIIRGGKSDYDLATDESTNKQRYLM